MSRRKQPNPNKVKQMEGASEDKRPGDTISAALSADAEEQSEDKEEQASSQTEEENGGKNSQATEPPEEGEDRAELSPINSMLSAVMNANQINGQLSSTSTTPTKTPIKSPAPNRVGRRNQDGKEERSSFICPLCEKNCLTQHQLTMHIRQHNSDNGGTDHSCSICGKALSSASSLDRHMLVHSGERPYKCSVCGQTFTTNGNMHRHMKIHDKDPNSTVNFSPPSPNKRRRPSAKRKPSLEDESDRADEPPNKKGSEDNMAEKDGTKGEEELVHCPVCFVTIPKNDMESHMETHPDASLRCDMCCVTFRTHRGLLRHNAAIHKQLPTDPAGRPFIQNNPSIPLGFNDLAFIDFSCRKFPQIAQVWCETNLRRCSSKFHRFVCETCNKAFPLQSALNLHTATHNTEDRAQEDTTPVSQKDVQPEKASFMESLGLKCVSQVKPPPTEDEAFQATLDSIHFVRVEPSKSSLPQEANGISLPLLDPNSLQSLSQMGTLSFLSLQPFQQGFIVQPDNSVVVKPISGESTVELADIQQILKMTSSAPNQFTLPPLSKAPCNPTQSNCKQMPPLKPKPLVAPRTSMTASTPPPLMNTQQASSCCLSPSLPPPANQLLRTPEESSSSSSSSSSSQDMEKAQPEGDAALPVDAGDKKIAQDVKEVVTAGGKKEGCKGTFPCRFCDQSFTSSSILQTHMRYHLGASSYQCSICEYAAPDKATLIRHLRTHSGERPYVCRVCHYPFTVKANCERHLRKKHMKTIRKDIEKNIEYVSTGPGSLDTTLDSLDATSGQTVCSFCGEDLKSYRALQIHLRTHNGCQRKPFECGQCGAAFLAKRNCIHHLLKQHPEVQEREIENYISSSLPAATATVSQPCEAPQNGLLTQPVKVEDMSFYASDPDQPLDFSSKGQGRSGATGDSCSIKQERFHSPQVSSYDWSMEPIDLSIPKNPENKLTKDTIAIPLPGPAVEIKKEELSPRANHICSQDKVLEEKPRPIAPYHIPILPSPNGPLSANRAGKLKPLLPKPTSASTTTKELPPLASIAQIISSVSAAPVLLKRENAPSNSCSIKGLQVDPEPAGKQQSAGAGSPTVTSSDESQDSSKKRGKKRPHPTKDQPENSLAESTVAGGIDLESSGEFASVEKMLATTDANKFSPYLQPSGMMPAKEEPERPSTSEDEKDGQEDKQRLRPQTKGKKNAYSSSLQKMTCPYCPRVFPWASSLQRHMLTHTGQKPYPCPQCDAFFSTKSNCERHLLRKHGVANRTLRHNGAAAKPKADEGSPESAESTSDTEPAAGEALDLSGNDAKQVDADSTKPISEGEKTVTEQPARDGEPERDDKCAGPDCSKNHTEEHDDDSHSNKSLDLNFARNLIDFKFSEGGQQQQPPPAGCSMGQETCAQEESKLSCGSCGKHFRLAATLVRHQKAHVCENQEEEGRKTSEESSVSQPEEAAEAEDKEKKTTGESEEHGSGADSGSEEEEQDKEERSDEEGGATEPKNSEGESGSKADKRKKVCSVCNKRFWSLQDLTRHMRSHTGKRPYRCQTCDRTFTLKHSLVRHQRIHQKPRGDEERAEGSTSGAHGTTGEDEAASSRSGSESESAPCSTSPPSENESEGARAESAGPGGEDPLQAGGPSQALEDPTAEPSVQNGPASGSVEPSGDYIQGLLKIHSSPPLEHMLPAGEPPMVGVE
ncbi:ras-responsive element-binding protein 1 [Arapaima gigas]